MIPTFTLTRRGEDWELQSAGKYEEARRKYLAITSDKFAHDYDEVVMVRVRKRKRFGPRIKAISTDEPEPELEESDEDELSDEDEPEQQPAKKKPGRPRKNK